MLFRSGLRSDINALFVGDTAQIDASVTVAGGPGRAYLTWTMWGGVVGTLMTNMAIEVALRRQGIELVRAKVGDRYVLEELGARGWLLGGESSGHLLALDRHSTGDGIVSALQVLQAVQRGGRSLAEVLADVPLFPQTMINVRLAEGQDWRANATLAAETEAVKAGLGERGRVLIRASGTEPVLRVMVEAREAALADSHAKRLAEAVASAAA